MLPGFDPVLYTLWILNMLAFPQAFQFSISPKSFIFHLISCHWISIKVLTISRALVRFRTRRYWRIYFSRIVAILYIVLVSHSTHHISYKSFLHILLSSTYLFNYNYIGRICWFSTLRRKAFPWAPQFSFTPKKSTFHLMSLHLIWFVVTLFTEDLWSTLNYPDTRIKW